MDKTERSEILSILVVNEPGVTARLGSLFGRRGFNIDSFTASPTNDPTLTRITIATTENSIRFLLRQRNRNSSKQLILWIPRAFTENCCF